MNGGMVGCGGLSLNSNFGSVLDSSSAGSYGRYSREPFPDYLGKDKIETYYTVNDSVYNNSYVTSPSTYSRYINQHNALSVFGYHPHFSHNGECFNRMAMGLETIPDRVNSIDDSRKIVSCEYLSRVNDISPGVRSTFNGGSKPDQLVMVPSQERKSGSPSGAELVKLTSGGYSNTKSNLSKLKGSGWKEWSSYSKLLPLAVVELDVQNECNYLSGLFTSFSNTVKGFISKFEFEKLMEHVNIIEVGYRGTIFGVMDRNQDDYITQVEFLTGMLIFRPYNSKEKNSPNFNKLRLQFIFFYYDSNRDGQLSIEELAKLIEHISIIKVTINSKKGESKKKTQISDEKSRKLASQVIREYLNKDCCSYDDFFLLVHNGILNGTVNLLRCRNDIFLQKKNQPTSSFSPPSQAPHSKFSYGNSTQNPNIHQHPHLSSSQNVYQVKTQRPQVTQISPHNNANNHHLQNPIPENKGSTIYNTRINVPTEKISQKGIPSFFNDESIRCMSRSYVNFAHNGYYPSNIPQLTEALYASKSKTTTPQGTNQNQNNTRASNSASNNNAATPPPSQLNSTLRKNNSISSTITRKHEDQFTAYSNSPPNNALLTPEPLSNYRSAYESSSTFHNIPSEGRLNINFSPYH